MAKQEKLLERTYTIPLRREFLKVAKWKRSNKAVRAAKQFLQRHMKSENVRLGMSINELLWSQGNKNPPPRVKVIATKDEKGLVKAELFGFKTKEEKRAERAKGKEAAKAGKAAKVEAKPEEKKELSDV